MNCNRVQDLLLASLDEPIAAAERTDVDAHLASCADCVRALREFVSTREILKGLGVAEETEATPPLSEPLVQRILAARASAAATHEADRRSERKSG